MEKISIIVPCYNEEEAMPIFYEEINKIAHEMKKVDFEFIFVNDGSKDKTLEVARDLSKKDKRVRYVSFSRNFGKESAMYAGLEAAKGDYVAIMDVDLQDPPALIPEMYSLIKNEDEVIDDYKSIFDYMIEFYLEYYYYLLPGIIVILSAIIIISKRKENKLKL